MKRTPISVSNVKFNKKSDEIHLIFFSNKNNLQAPRSLVRVRVTIERSQENLHPGFHTRISNRIT